MCSLSIVVTMLIAQHFKDKFASISYSPPSLEYIYICFRPLQISASCPGYQLQRSLYPLLWVSCWALGLLFWWVHWPCCLNAGQSQVAGNNDDDRRINGPVRYVVERPAPLASRHESKRPSLVCAWEHHVYHYHLFVTVPEIWPDDVNNTSNSSVIDSAYIAFLLVNLS